MKVKYTYITFFFGLLFVLGCSTNNAADLKNQPKSVDTIKLVDNIASTPTDKDSIPKPSVDRTKTIKTDTILLNESYNETDEPINEYLTKELQPIRDNFKKLNSIKSWTSVDKRKLENMPENGAAEYYYLTDKLLKIIASYPTGKQRQIAEYYILNGQLSFVLEKSATEAEELIIEKNYFINEKLVHQINNQDCGAPFADDYLIKEQARIKDNYKRIKDRLRK